MPSSASACALALSSKSDTMKSRHARIRGTSSSPRTACATPGVSSAAARTSPGRRSVFDGMQAQYLHSPATSSRSTIATRIPPFASSPAQVSPDEPAPMTIAS
jgi:hypothetical protein